MTVTATNDDICSSISTMYSELLEIKQIAVHPRLQTSNISFTFAQGLFSGCIILAASKWSRMSLRLPLTVSASFMAYFSFFLHYLWNCHLPYLSYSTRCAIWWVFILIKIYWGLYLISSVNIMFLFISFFYSDIWTEIQSRLPEANLQFNMYCSVWILSMSLC